MKEDKQKIKFFMTIFLIFLEILFFNLGFFKLCKENFIENKRTNENYIIIKFFIIPIIILIISIIIFEIFYNNEITSNKLKEKTIKLNKFSLLKNEKEINI